MENWAGEFGKVLQGLLREDERAGEERLRRLSSVLDPQNDFEELVLSKVVEVSIELDRVGRARRERMVEADREGASG